jgi:AcrR family transcriptional regulator
MSVIDNNSTNRAERRRLHTRALLMAAAGELLVEVGYPKLTIKAITDRADVGYGTFYLHFTDKDDIVWAVMRQTMESWRVDMEAKVLAFPSPQREYQSWVYIFEYAGQVRESILTMLGSKGSAKLLQRYQDYLATMHEANLREGRYSSGLDLPPVFLAQFMTGALVRLLIWWAETPNDYSPQQMADMLYEAAYREGVRG